MNDSYIWIEKGRAERRFADGRRVPLDGVPVSKQYGPGGGYWQLSSSNGLMATQRELARAKRLDAKLGVPIDYVPVKSRGGRTIYRAGFESRAQKRAWLKAHRRVDFDAGYRDPAPGDFRGTVPQER